MNECKRKIEKAYLKARYVVLCESEKIFFHINENSERINKLLEDYNAETYAFITAHNPYSEILTNEENETRQAGLIKLLQEENFRFLKGYGSNTEETWREESLFVFDISEEKAVEIAKGFEQNAIVYGAYNIPPRLVWCR